MKEDKIKDNDNVCPYCKRHCSLQNPHCSKGRALAKKKSQEKSKESNMDKKIERAKDKKTNDKKEKDKNVKDKLEKKLSKLLEQKESNKPKKTAMYHILTMLNEVEERTKKDIQNEVNIEPKKLENILDKMQRKGYITLMEDGNKIVLSKSVKSSWNSLHEDK